MENIPAPDEVINNVNKYRMQISVVMSKVNKVSDDIRANNMIVHYFTTLGEFLGIEPLKLSTEEISTIKNITSNKKQSNNLKPSGNNSDTDDEE